MQRYSFAGVLECDKEHHAEEDTGNVMAGNITFLMIFAVSDPSPLTLWINCSF